MDALQRCAVAQSTLVMNILALLYMSYKIMHINKEVGECDLNWVYQTAHWGYTTVPPINSIGDGDLCLLFHPMLPLTLSHYKHKYRQISRSVVVKQEETAFSATIYTTYMSVSFQKALNPRTQTALHSLFRSYNQKQSLCLCPKSPMYQQQSPCLCPKSPMYQQLNWLIPNYHPLL